MIKSGGIIRAARLQLGLSRKEFGILIAERVGRVTPYTPQMIYAWEKGLKMPRHNVREACADDAARLCVKEIERITGVSINDADKVSLIALITTNQS